MYAKLFNVFCCAMLILAIGILVFGGVVPRAAAQDGGCNPDLSAVYAALARAQVAFDSGDQAAGLAAVAEARDALDAIEEACSQPVQAAPSAGGQVLFEDDFSDPGWGFRDFEGDTKHAWHAEGEYHVASLASGRVFSALSGLFLGDFVLEFDAVVVRDEAGNGAYGLAFRGQEGLAGNYYLWRVSSDGTTNIHVNVGGITDRLESYSVAAIEADDWLTMPSIQTGTGVTNHLRLECQGTDMRFYVNGELLLQGVDANLESGVLALVVSGDQPVEVMFDNVRIYAVDEAPPPAASTGPVEGGHPPATSDGPDFAVSLSGFHPCAEWPTYVEFQIVNTGNITFESSQTGIVEKDTGKSIYSFLKNSRPFTQAGGCPPGDESLPVGAVGHIAYNISSADPGTVAVATIKLCSEDGATGDCVTKTFEFTIKP
ncbi:MAG: hypothetical protein JW966_01600 [Anaerolineae bacterium]|nr:hypothetical protein [Anaerolineae bacterium]